MSGLALALACAVLGQTAPEVLPPEAYGPVSSVAAIAAEALDGKVERVELRGDHARIQVEVGGRSYTLRLEAGEAPHGRLVVPEPLDGARVERALAKYRRAVPWRKVAVEVLPYEVDAEARAQALRDQELALAARAGKTSVTDEADDAASERWAVEAERALEEGDWTRALSLADVATRSWPPSPRALSVWDRLNASAPWPWAPLALLLGAGLWLLLAARGGRRAVLLALSGTVAAAAGMLWVAAAEPPSIPDEIPAALRAPLAGGPCAAEPWQLGEREARLPVTCEGQAREIVVDAEGRVYLQGGAVGARFEGARLRVAALVEGARYRPAWEPSEAGRLGARSPGERQALAWSLALAILALLALGMAAPAMAGALRDALREPGGALLGLALLGALVAHMLMPPRLVMFYTGYDLTARLALLEGLPRYGAGGVWLYLPALLEVDHAHVQLLNRTMGMLTLLPVVALTRALAPERFRGWTTAGAVAIYALSPVVWRDHLAEGIGPGLVLVLSAGLACLAMGLRGRRELLVWSTPLLALAACTRPEVMVALPLVGVAVMARQGRAGRSEAALLVGALGLLLVPQALWLAEQAATQVAQGGIAGASEGLGTRVLATLTSENLFFEGRWVSAAVLLWVLPGALAAGPERALRLALLGAGLAWLAVTAVDLPRVSIPRVHLPVLVLWLPLIAAGMAWLSRGEWLGGVANKALGLFVLASMVTSLEPALRGSHEEAEEWLIRTAAAELLADPAACVATPGFEDPPAVGKTQRHFPRYLFGDTAVVGLRRFMDGEAACEEGDALLLLGVRCHMAMRAPSEEAPPSGWLPICEEASGHGWPVLEGELDNGPQEAFPVYPAADTLEVSIRRVER